MPPRAGKPALAPRPSAVKAAPTLRAAKTTGAATLKAATAELPKTVTPGVVTGQAYKDLMDYAKEKGFAMPGVNIVGTNSINSCLEAAAKYGGPMYVNASSLCVFTLTWRTRLVDLLHLHVLPASSRAHEERFSSRQAPGVAVGGIAPLQTVAVACLIAVRAELTLEWRIQDHHVLKGWRSVHCWQGC